MKPNDEEKFALKHIFQGAGLIETAVNDGICSADITERTNTVVGFFSTIAFKERFPDDLERFHWDWNFYHKKLPHGGSFMAWYVPPNVIELEAVAHDGDWPIVFNPDDFRSS